MLPPITEEQKNKPLKFKVLPENPHIRIKPRAAIEPRPPKVIVEKPEEKADMSPIIMASRRKISVYKALRYTAPRFRDDTDDFRKNPSSRLHVQEMATSGMWRNLRRFRPGGYGYLISEKGRWFDFSNKCEGMTIPLSAFMNSLYDFTQGMQDELVANDRRRITDGVYVEDEEFERALPSRLAKEKLLPEKLPTGMASALFPNAAFQARHIFREGVPAGEEGRLKFRMRWSLFEVDMDKESECLLLRIGSKKGKHVLLCTDFATQRLLPPVKELKLSSGLQINWRKGNPDSAAITFRIAKTKPIIVA